MEELGGYKCVYYGALKSGNIIRDEKIIVGWNMECLDWNRLREMELGR